MSTKKKRSTASSAVSAAGSSGYSIDSGHYQNGNAVARHKNSVVTDSFLASRNGAKVSMTDENPYNFCFKVMLLGDTCSGKTCLLVRFKDNTFLNNNFISTVGIDYRNKILELDGAKVKMQVWDTAGQERFRSLTHAYYRDAHGLLLVFDVTNAKSFENMRSWLADVKEYAGQNVICALVGNKADLTTQRKVKTSDAEKLAKENNIIYFETSAKTGQNVDAAFNAVARAIIQQRLNQNGTDTAKSESIALSTVATKSATGSCCRVW